MTKSEFLSALENRLSGLPKDDVQKSIDYYSEIIDDRMEEGLTEEEAVRGEGNPRLYQSDSFQKAATYILYQIYYGNITPYDYTYDKAKQRVKKLEM